MILLFEQVRRGHFEFCSNGIDKLDRRIARSALKVADVGPVDADHVGERFLA